VLTFLEEMSKIFKIVLFTSINRIYADEIIKKIDPYGEIFSYRLYKDELVLSKKGVIYYLSRFL